MIRTAFLLGFAAASSGLGDRATAATKHIAYPNALLGHWTPKLAWCSAWGDHDHDGLVIEPTVASEGDEDGELISVRRMSPREWVVLEEWGDATSPHRLKELYVLSSSGRRLSVKHITLNGKAVAYRANHYVSCERNGE